MSQLIKAISLTAPHQVAIKSVEIPHKKQTDVLVKIEAAGICGSDIGAYRGTNPLVTYPRILGHEVVGTILETGVGMPQGITQGTRVILEPYVYCGHCYPCSIGRTNCCEKLKVLGVHIDGAMQEIVAHPAHLVVPVPKKLSIEEVPLAEPLTIAIHALHRTKLSQGEHIVIIGAGAIGLMAGLVALSYGATPIIIDVLQDRLDYAYSIGIPHVLQASENVVEKIQQITQGRMAEVVMEASGANTAIQASLDYASFAGRIALTGWPKVATPLPTNLITFKELNIYGSRTSQGEFEEALQLLATGKVEAKKIISKVVSFDEIPQAIQELSEHPERYIKINAVFNQ